MLVNHRICFILTVFTLVYIFIAKPSETLTGILISTSFGLFALGINSKSENERRKFEILKIESDKNSTLYEMRVQEFFVLRKCLSEATFLPSSDLTNTLRDYTESLARCNFLFSTGVINLIEQGRSAIVDVQARLPGAHAVIIDLMGSGIKHEGKLISAIKDDMSINR